MRFVIGNDQPPEEQNFEQHESSQPNIPDSKKRDGRARQNKKLVPRKNKRRSGRRK